MVDARPLATLRTGLIVGCAGGLAEIAWVTLYAGLTGTDPAVIARGVTTAAGMSVLLPQASPVALGVGVHMALAVLLGSALALAWQALRAKKSVLANPYPFMLTALGSVWAMNFFVVLPLVSPAFTNIVPYAVSLTSKLLFGVAAAEVIRLAHRRGRGGLFRDRLPRRADALGLPYTPADRALAGEMTRQVSRLTYIKVLVTV